MSLAMMSLIFEGAVSGLLIAVIVYAIKLNRRIIALRSQEGELKEMIAQFNDAATQAEISAGHLKAVGTESERNLRATIERAQAMRDDLSFMIDRGGNISDRVDRSIERSRKSAPVMPPREPVAPASEELDDLEVERNAERAVEGLVDRFANQAESSLWLAATRESPKGAADIMPLGDKNSGIDREHWFDDDPAQDNSPVIAGPKVSAWTPGAASTAVVNPTDEQPASPRSDAEREMLKALRISGVRR
jgi:hypothetical protein